MHNLLTILFAAIDSGVWSKDRAVSWANDVTMRVHKPKEWLVGLASSSSEEETLNTIRSAMINFELSLPESFGDLLAGLVLLKFDRGWVQSKAALDELLDVIDAYGTSVIDIETAGDLGLDNIVYTPLRVLAETELSQLIDPAFLSQERRFIAG